jgi:hypothetical protein
LEVTFRARERVSAGDMGTVQGVMALVRSITLCLSIAVSIGCARSPESQPVSEPSSASSQGATTAPDRPPASELDPDFAPEEGFTLLRLSDFKQHAAEPGTWAETGGRIVTTGKPRGYIYSSRPYGNFTWRGEFRFPSAEGEADQANLDQSNTGFMLCIQEPHKVWPRSLEVQGKHVEMASIKANGGAAVLTIREDPAARDAARLPVGEWNVIEIQCRDGAVTATLNGSVICRSEPGELTSGQIGLQAENFPVEFRRLRIREDG